MNFALFLLTYVAVAVLILLKLKNWIGVLLVCASFFVFPYAASHDLAAALAVWSLAALVNARFQYQHFRQHGVGKFPPSVVVASLFIWPIQGAALVFSADQEREVESSKAEAREKIGSLPATVGGVVSYAHHIGSEPPYEMVWLEAYGDLEFIMSSELYDEIGVQEGAEIELQVEERSGDVVGSEDPILWATSGSRHQDRG